MHSSVIHRQHQRAVTLTLVHTLTCFCTCVAAAAVTTGPEVAACCAGCRPTQAAAPHPAQRTRRRQGQDRPQEEDCCGAAVMGALFLVLLSVSAACIQHHMVLCVQKSIDVLPHGACAAARALCIRCCCCCCRGCCMFLSVTPQCAGYAKDRALGLWV